MSRDKDIDTRFLIKKKDPKHMFNLEDCGFLNSSDTQKIRLYNKNIRKECLISIIMDKNSEKECDHIDSQSIYGKWDYLLITLFGLRFTVKREKNKDKTDKTSNYHLDCTEKFIIKRPNEENKEKPITFIIKRIYSKEKPDKTKFAKISKFDTSSQYMSIDNKQITFYEQITNTKITNQSEQDKKNIFPLESISCKTAVLYIISLAYRLKMQELLDSVSELTLTDSENIFVKLWKLTKSIFARILYYLKKFLGTVKNTLFTRKQTPNKLVKDLLNFKVRCLSEIPIDVDNAYATIEIWKKINETFYLDDLIKEVDGKQNALIDYERNKNQKTLNCIAIWVSSFALLFTGISTWNDAENDKKITIEAILGLFKKIYDISSSFIINLFS